MPRALVEDGTSLRSISQGATCRNCGKPVHLGTCSMFTQPPTKPPTAIEGCQQCGEVITVGQSHACTVTTPVPSHLAMLMAPLRYGLGTREEIQAELDGIAMAVRTFGMKQPDQVMREAAAYSARLTELAVLLHRAESQDRQYLRVRTQQVERWQHELEFQYKIASRLVEVMRQDLALLGGQP